MAKISQSKRDETIPELLRIFRGTGGGIESWLNEETPKEIIIRINKIDKEPLSFEHLNQLLILSHEAGLSRGFFEYYWLQVPSDEHVHPYNTRSLTNFPNKLATTNHVDSVQHLAWGLERLYVDALLFFGNVREGYRFLRNKSAAELCEFFRSKCYDTKQLLARDFPLSLQEIAKDNRYLIAEIACKTYDPETFSELQSNLTVRFQLLKSKGVQKITAQMLLDPKTSFPSSPAQLTFDLYNAEFSLTEIWEQEIKDHSDIERSMTLLSKKFVEAREKALNNTKLYLSMAYDLDAYVATSMRNREDFRLMAERCSEIFGNAAVKKYRPRFFDPTLSAAENHEDKGLIECLMVKCAKLLIYMAGLRDSYGKDSEAAMALSQGKPVIFLCDTQTRTAFYRDVHPLSRLIDFSTGTAVGAVVTDQLTDVPLLIDRIFSNSMEYYLDRKANGFLLLKEKLTNSVVRVQTSNKLLNETFWNYYHSNPFGSR